MTWFAYQRALRDVLLSEDPQPNDFSALGADARRWQTYRRMVRSRFYETIDHGFERTVALVGADAFHRWIDRFVAQDPPRSPYLRDLPGEFLRFVEPRRDALGDAGALPPYALDLMRYEWAELDTAYSHEELDTRAVAPLDMERIAAMSPAHRLLELEYPVHQIGADGGGMPLTPSPVRLLLYRDRVTHDVETLELTPIAATLLREIARGGASLTSIVQSSAAAYGATIDVAFVGALSTLLADLTERGVLLGSFAGSEKTK